MANAQDNLESDAAPQLRKFANNLSRLNIEDFSKVCLLPGAPEEVISLILTPLLQLGDDLLSSEEQAERMRSILQTLVEKLDSFSTLEQFVWLIRTTISVQLTSVGSSQFIRFLTKLYAAIRTMDATTFKRTPNVIETVAQSFRDVVIMTKSNPVSIVYRLQMAHIHLFYYSAVAIVFASIESLLYPDKLTLKYQLQGMGHLLIHLFAFDLLQKQQKSEIIHQLLLLLHMYQILVIQRQVNKTIYALREEHGYYAEHMHMKHEHLTLFRKWLDTVNAIECDQSVKDLLNDHLIPLAENAKLCSRPM